MHNNIVSVGSPQQLVTTNTLPQEMNMNVSVGNSIVTAIGTSIVPVETPTVTTSTTPTTTPGSLDLFGKKKRGRPRKYDADGNLNPSYKKIVKAQTPILTPPPGFTLSTNEFSSKKGRGKSTGFVNYQTFSSFGEF